MEESLLWAWISEERFLNRDQHIVTAFLIART